MVTYIRTYCTETESIVNDCLSEKKPVPASVTRASALWYYGKKKIPQLILVGIEYVFVAVRYAKKVFVLVC